MNKSAQICLIMLLACSCNKKLPTNDEAIHFRLPFRIYILDSTNGNQAIAYGGKYSPDSIRRYDLYSNGTVSAAKTPCQDHLNRVFFCGWAVDAYGAGREEFFNIRFDMRARFYFGNNQADTFHIVKNTRDSVFYYINSKLIYKKDFSNLDSLGAMTDMTYYR